MSIIAIAAIGLVAALAVAAYELSLAHRQRSVEEKAMLRTAERVEEQRRRREAKREQKLAERRAVRNTRAAPGYPSARPSSNVRIRA